MTADGPAEEAGADVLDDDVDELDEVELDDIEDPDALAADLELEDELDEANRRDGALAVGVLEYLAKAIVDHPEAVEVELDDSHRRGIELRLHVAQDDMGKVIGRRGRVAQALRTVVRAAGAREGVDVQVEIVD